MNRLLVFPVKLQDGNERSSTITGALTHCTNHVTFVTDTHISDADNLNKYLICKVGLALTIY